jgi:hypothetical protein
VIGSVLALVASLAGVVVEGPCQEVASAVAADAVRADDSVLREAASLAESAGDFEQAARLLRQLRERTHDEAIAAEAADAEQSLSPKALRAPCQPTSRRVVVAIDKALFLAPSERTRLAGIVVAELNARDIDAVVAPPDALLACGQKERCIREQLNLVDSGAYLRLQPTRVGPVVSIGVDVIGAGGRARHDLQLDADVNKWSPVLTKPLLDDVVAILPAARRRTVGEREREARDEFNADPIIAGVTITTLGALVGGAGVALLVNPDLVGPNNAEQTLLVRNVGLGGVIAGGVIVVGALLTVALLIDASD